MKKLFLLLFLALPLSAQVFDPDPALPGAQQAAQMRYFYAMLGWSPPPVGWLCTIVQTPESPYFPVEVQCIPDESLVNQQQQQQDDWLRRLEDRMAAIRGRSRNSPLSRRR